MLVYSVAIVQALLLKINSCLFIFNPVNGPRVFSVRDSFMALPFEIHLGSGEYAETPSLYRYVRKAAYPCSLWF